MQLCRGSNFGLPSRQPLLLSNAYQLGNLQMRWSVDQVSTVGRGRSLSSVVVLERGKRMGLSPPPQIVLHSPYWFDCG